MVKATGLNRRCRLFRAFIPCDLGSLGGDRAPARLQLLLHIQPTATSAVLDSTKPIKLPMRLEQIRF
jgi:hypothetical protein